MTGLPSEIPNKPGIFFRNTVLWISVIPVLAGIGNYANGNFGKMILSGAIAIFLWWVASKIRITKKFQGGVGSYK